MTRGRRTIRVAKWAGVVACVLIGRPLGLCSATTDAADTRAGFARPLKNTTKNGGACGVPFWGA